MHWPGTYISEKHNTLCFIVLWLLYRFKSEWLTNGYSNKQNIEEAYGRKEITKGERDALMAVHDRDCKEATEPSALDLEFLNKKYSMILSV